MMCEDSFVYIIHTYLLWHIKLIAHASEAVAAVAGCAVAAAAMMPCSCSCFPPTSIEFPECLEFTGTAN